MSISLAELGRVLRDNPEVQIVGNDLPIAISLTHTPFTEHDLQVSIIAECDRRAFNEPLWGLIYAIPNGGHRKKGVAAKLKAEGVRAGVPDLCWPIARHGYHGLYMELKIGRNRPTDAQRAWINTLIAQNYYVVVTFEFNHALEQLEWYWKE